MQRLRLADLSVYYWIKDILHKAGMNTIDDGYQVNTYRAEVPYYVKVTDDYPSITKEGVVLPSVVLTMATLNEAGLQIGGGFKNYRNFDVDIFARRDGERDDLANVIYEGLDKTTTVRDFNIAFPEYVYVPANGILVEDFPGLVPDALSDLEIMNKSVEYITPTSPSEVDRHRAVIRLRTLDLR